MFILGMVIHHSSTREEVAKVSGKQSKKAWYRKHEIMFQRGALQ